MTKLRNGILSTRLRVSIVQYLNTAPLVWGFTHGPLTGKYDLSFTVPSQCAEALRAGEADIAIIPAIEYQRIPNLVMLPEFAIASKRQVRSLLLVAKKPIAEVCSIALDSSSRSTQALTRILCADHWHIAPHFSEATPDVPKMLRTADAALLIGDPALRFAMQLEGQTRPGADGALVGDAQSAGAKASAPLYVYDMVEQWQRSTQLPAVLAVWAARAGVVSPEVQRDFAISRDFGLSHISEIAEVAAFELKLPAPAMSAYLRQNIDYSLDEQNLRGLEHFFARAAALRLIDAQRQIVWAGSAASVRHTAAKS